MARAVIGRLITSTLPTLVVVPVTYTYFDDFGSWIKKRVVSKEKEAKVERERKKRALRRAGLGD